MEYKITRGIPNYGDWDYYTPVQYPHFAGFQQWSKTTHDNDYTSLFINLVDNVNESTLYFGRPIDYVSGYTLSSIESSILKRVYGKSSLYVRLIGIKPAGVTDSNIDLLLSYY